MFKARKRNAKQKGAMRRKHDDDDEKKDKAAEAEKDDKEDEEEEGTAAAIARVKKKRKLLTELQYKKGTDAASLLKGREEHHPADLEGVDASDTAGNAAASSSQEGVMEQKHKQALENYVEEKLAGMVGGETATTNNNKDGKGVQFSTTDDDVSGTNSNPNRNNNKLTKEELYRQLAQTSENMVGRARVGQQEVKNKDGDVGTGGAMLVAGTGLAEVILPVEERLKAVQATEEATGVLGPRANHNNNKSSNYYGMPKSQVPVPAGAARFQVSAADRHRHYANNHNNQNNNQRNNNSPVPTQQQQQQQSTAEEDQGRVGFDAARGKTTMAPNNNANGDGGGGNNNNNYGNSNNRDHKNRASDDKVYGNFLKHHRENQWRGR